MSIETWKYRSPKKKLGIGIDYGTANSAAAIFDGHRLKLIDLDRASPVPSIMPSALYLNREFFPKVGWQAIESYLGDNVERKINLEREEVGEFLLSIDTRDGYFEDWIKVNAFTDRDLPSRLFRSVKTWLGSVNLNTLKVFDRDLNLIALVTPVLEHTRKRILQSTELYGEGSLAPYIGRPVQYSGGNADTNRVALERMNQACQYAGFESSVPYPEPVAATLSYLWNGNMWEGSTYLTFDFGGGTLDLSVVSYSQKGFTILGTHGIDIGGDTIDQKIYREKVFPELGKGALVTSSNVKDTGKVQFRFNEFEERLLTWQHFHELNRNELRELIVQGMREGGTVKERLARLLKLITYNQSYQVFQAIETAKRALSENEKATIDVPTVDLCIAINRHELGEIVADILVDIEETIARTLDLAGCSCEDIDAVVCTGGSSRLPPVRNLLQRLFPEKLVEHSTFTGIATGLAIANFYGYQFDPDS